MRYLCRRIEVTNIASEINFKTFQIIQINLLKEFELDCFIPIQCSPPEIDY